MGGRTAARHEGLPVHQKPRRAFHSRPRYPADMDVFVAAGFSGRGFKFCSVIGKIIADFCLDRPPAWDLRRFRLARLTDASG